MECTENLKYVYFLGHVDIFIHLLFRCQLQKYSLNKIAFNGQDYLVRLGDEFKKESLLLKFQGIFTGILGTAGKVQFRVIMLEETNGAKTEVKKNISLATTWINKI